MLGSVVSAGLTRHPRRQEQSPQVSSAKECDAGIELAEVAGDDYTQRLVAEVAEGGWSAAGASENKTVM